MNQINVIVKVVIYIVECLPFMLMIADYNGPFLGHSEDLLDQEMSLTVDPRYSWHRNESYPFGVDPVSVYNIVRY